MSFSGCYVFGILVGGTLGILIADGHIDTPLEMIAAAVLVAIPGIAMDIIEARRTKQ